MVRIGNTLENNNVHDIYTTLQQKTRPYIVDYKVE